MVLVRTEVPARPKNQSDLNAGPVAESHSAQVSLPQQAPKPGLSVEPLFPVDCANNSQAPAAKTALTYYDTQLRLLEEQNKKRLLAARQQQAETEQKQDDNKRAQDSLESNVASREGYHMQQMVLEQESGKRLVGARHQLAGQRSGTTESRNQGHDAHAMVGSYEGGDRASYMNDSLLLDEQNKRRLRMADRAREADSTTKEVDRHECCAHHFTKTDDQRHNHRLADYEIQLMLLEQQNKRRIMQQRAEEDAAKQPTISQPSSESQAEDKWEKGPFPAGQGVISGYQVQLMAIENRRKEEAAVRSQTEVEFSEQRRRYLAEETEMSRMSGQQLPGGPGSSCSPPSIHSAFRLMPRPDVPFDNLYDN